MIKIGIPVVNQLEHTKKCVSYMLDNAVTGSVKAIIIDNGSTIPYSEYEWPEGVDVIRNEFNTGYYQPLLQVKEGTTRADIVGLIHNDLYIYEAGWDQLLIDTFVQNGKLGIVGVCGSNEIDDRGGRGGGTISNFLGKVGQLQEHTGRRVTGINNAIILDSMFMAMRQPLVDCLDVDVHTTLCHFMDKLWPLKIYNQGYSVGVLGLSVDHIGGQTSVLEGVSFEKDCARWCKQEGIAYQEDKAGEALYLESERRFLDYARRHGQLPFRV